MRSLIICTGTYDWIDTKLLPSLYETAGYTGDVLIISYGEFDLVDQLELSLKYEKHVMVKFFKKKLSTFTADRFRTYEIALRKIYQKYDVIMHVDGNDIEFFSSIDELLEMAKFTVCVIPEPRNNDNPICASWVTINSLPIEYWEAIKGKPVLNCGVFLGPAAEMYYITKFVSDNVAHDSRFGIDQLVFNAIFYYFDLAYCSVDRKWDYHFYDEGWKYDLKLKPYYTKFADKQDQSIWINFTDVPIAIMHYAGPQKFKSVGDRGKAAVTKKRNWLFDGI